MAKKHAVPEYEEEVVYKTPPEFRKGQQEYRKLRTSKEKRVNDALNHAFNVSPDGNPSILNYQTKRFDLVCAMLMAQPGPEGVPFTREQIDTHPSTKNLPEEDKKILVKYWPKFKRDQEKAYEVIELRKKEVDLITKASKDVDVLREAEGLDKLPLHARLNKVAVCVIKQATNAAEHLAVTSHDQVFTDDHSQAIFKSRLAYTKEYMGLARTMADLAARIEESESLSAEDGQLTQDTIEQLNRANAMLLKKGVVSYIDAEVKIRHKDDEDEDDS